MNLIKEIHDTIVEAIPDAEVYVLDPMNDGVHLEALVISESFKGKSLVSQQKTVMQSLTNHFSTTLHALALKTFTPEKWEQSKSNYKEVINES